MPSRHAKIRQTKVTTPPFDVTVEVSANLGHPTWGQAKAEAIVLERLDVEHDIKTAIRFLKARGVYTVQYDSRRNVYTHRAFAPDGLTFDAVEVIPPWWEAEDLFPMQKVATGYGLIMSLLPSVSMEDWRKSNWPDRPHP